MEMAEIKQRISTTLDHLSLEQLILVDNLLQVISSEANFSAIPDDENDPLAKLRNSDFIGCFEDDHDLSVKSEEIAQEILSKKSY
jgi:hypothetical protein